MRLFTSICLLILGHGAAFAQLEADDDLALRAGPNEATPLNVGANDVFPSNASFEIVRQPRNGEVRIATSGWVYFTPQSGFTGMDSFTYRIRQGSSTSRVALAKVRVRFSVAAVTYFYENFPDHDVNLDVSFLGHTDTGPELLEMWSDVPSFNPPRYVWIQPGQNSWSKIYRISTPNTVQRGRLYYRFNGEIGSIPVVNDPFNLNFRIGFGIDGALGYIDPNAVIGSTPYTLKASTPLVEVPAQFDGRRQTFTIKVKEARWSFPFTVEIRRGNQFWKASFKTVPVHLSTQLDSDRVKGGGTANLHVSFAGPVGSTGVVELRSNSPWASVPAKVTLPHYKDLVIVPVQTLGTSVERTVTIWARIRGVERKVTLTVVP